MQVYNVNTKQLTSRALEQQPQTTNDQTMIIPCVLRMLNQQQSGTEGLLLKKIQTQDFSDLR